MRDEGREGSSVEVDPRCPPPGPAQPPTMEVRRGCPCLPSAVQPMRDALAREISGSRFHRTAPQLAATAGSSAPGCTTYKGDPCPAADRGPALQHRLPARLCQSSNLEDQAMGRYSGVQRLTLLCKSPISRLLRCAVRVSHPVSSPACRLLSAASRVLLLRPPKGGAGRLLFSCWTLLSRFPRSWGPADRTCFLFLTGAAGEHRKAKPSCCSEARASESEEHSDRLRVYRAVPLAIHTSGSVRIRPSVCFLVQFGELQVRHMASRNMYREHRNRR